MPALKDKRHERFCQNLILGMTQVDAYRKAGGKQTTSAAIEACRWAGKPTIKERIAELQAQSETGTEDLRRKVVNFLNGVIDAKPTDVSDDSSLCEVRYVGKEGRRVPFLPSKHGAAERLAKMHGWDKDVLRIEASEKVIELAGDFE